MTLYEVVKELQEIALRQPTIRSAGEGSVYDFMNNNPSSRYCCFNITQTSHRQDEDTDYYGFNLFYIDRLVDDLSDNRLQIQSIGKEVLSNIVRVFCEDNDCDRSTLIFRSFTEKFVDETAGCYCEVEFAVPIDYECSENY